MVIRDLPAPGVNWYPFWRVSDDRTRVVSILRDDDRDSVCLALYDTVTGNRIAVLDTKGKTPSAIDLDDTTRRVCSKSLGQDFSLFQMWDLDSGRLVHEREFAGWDRMWMHFARNGELIVLYGERRGDEVRVLRASDLRPVPELESSTVRACDCGVWWAEGPDLHVWDLESDERFRLEDAQPDHKPLLACDRLQGRAVTSGGVDAIELWDLPGRRRVAELPARDHKGVSFTLDRRALVVHQEGGLCSLFAAEDGAPLAQNISFDGRGVIYYDPGLRRFHVWNDDGQVLRYVEGRPYLGDFAPTVSQPADQAPDA